MMFAITLVEGEHESSQVAASHLYPTLPQQLGHDAFSYISLQPSMVRMHSQQ
jgi:hypothetical protein